MSAHVPGFRAADRGRDRGRAVAGVPAPAAGASVSATSSRSIATSWPRWTAIVERGLIGPKRRGRRASRSSAGCCGPPARSRRAGSQRRRGPRRLVLAAALLVPTLAATLYAVLGSPDLPDRPWRCGRTSSRQTPSQPDVQQMVAQAGGPPGASRRTICEGWLMLGRSRAVLGDTPGCRRGVPPRARPRRRRSGCRRRSRRGADRRSPAERSRPRPRALFMQAGRGRAARSALRILSRLGRLPGGRASGRARPVAVAARGEPRRRTLAAAGVGGHPGGRQGAASSIPRRCWLQIPPPPVSRSVRQAAADAEDVAACRRHGARRPDGDDPRHGREAPGAHGC